MNYFETAKLQLCLWVFVVLFEETFPVIVLINIYRNRIIFQLKKIKMKLKTKTVFVFTILWSTLICQAQNEFSNIEYANRFFNNPPPNTNNKNLPTLTDFDLDGDLDLMTSYDGDQKIWTGNGNIGWNSTRINVEGGDNTIAMGACVWADLNNDGLLDLIVTPVSDSNMRILLQKYFRGTTIYFKDVSASVNTFFQYREAVRLNPDETRVAVGHFNNDDKLDLLITFYGNKDIQPLNLEEALKPMLLLQNDDEDLSFSKTNINTKFLSMGAKLCDYDRDGDLDAYIGSYRANKNRLLNWNYDEKNKTGTFSEVTHNATYLRKGNSTGGVDWANCTGMEWLDFDNDGDFDLLVSNLKHAQSETGISELFENKNGKLQLTFNRHGLAIYDYNKRHYAQQTISFDFDNDGDIDIIEPRTAQGRCTSFTDEGVRSQLYINNIENKYFNPVTILGGNYNDDFGAVAGDFNSDGDIDLFTAANYGWDCCECKDSKISDIKYLRNQLNNDNQFVKIRLEGDTPSNQLTAGIGAEIYIDNNDGGIMSRLVEISTSGQKTGTGYIKQFGLGNWDSKTTNVYVKWINTPVNKVEKFQLTTADINNKNAPYIITKNNGTLVDRNFYCEEGKTLDVTTEVNSYSSKKSFFEVAAETVVAWEIQMKRNDIEERFSGNWTVISYAGNSNPFRWNYQNKYDIKARALIKDTNGKQCYSKVAYGYGNINNGEDRLISEQAGLNTLIDVSPNPTNNFITVTANADLQNLKKIEIFNTNGKNVFTKDITNKTHQISLQNLPMGIYFVTVQTTKTIETIKLIKQ